MDMNKHTQHAQLSKKLKDIGLHESIVSQNSKLSPPAPHNRNTQREPIDGIWTTLAIKVV